MLELGTWKWIKVKGEWIKVFVDEILERQVILTSVDGKYMLVKIKDIEAVRDV